MTKLMTTVLLASTILTAPAFAQEASYPVTAISQVKEANTRVTALAIDFGRDLPLNWQLQSAFSVTAELKPVKSHAGDLLGNSAAPAAPRTILRAYTSDKPEIGSPRQGRYVIIELDSDDFNASSWYMGFNPAFRQILPYGENMVYDVDLLHDLSFFSPNISPTEASLGMLHFSARSAAEVAGIPQHFVAFSPSVLGSQPWQAQIVPAIDRHRASIGLLPVDNIQEHLFTDRPWLAADTILSPEGAQADTTVRSDAWILEDDRALPDDLVAFLDWGTPPVYLGFGSMRMAAESSQIGIEAIREVGYRVVLGRGWAGLDALDDGGDCFAVGEVNQQALFKRVAATIHHGGAGTTTTSAKVGAPQVIVPQAADQPYWAEQVARLGIGVAHPGSTPSLSSLSNALKRALAPETAAHASRLASSMASDGAAVTAARILR